MTAEINRNVGHLNCLHLWKIWNFIFLLILYIYVIYDSINIYIKFKKYSMDPGFGSNYSTMHINGYLICMILGFTCFAFTLYCLSVFNGNYADDNVRIGIDTNNFKIHRENDISWDPKEIGRSENNKHILWKRFKRNFLPYSFLMHYLSAICFLIPLPFLEAHQIKQRVLNPNAMWHTDLDFLFDPDNWHDKFTNNKKWRFTWFLRPQYFNIIFSLISLIFKYPRVFWASHKGFSFTFSVLITIAGLHVIIDYSSTCILIRLAANPDFIGRNLQITFLSQRSLMMLSMIGSFVLILSFWNVFEFGFQQFLENVSRYQYLMAIQCDESHDSSNLSNITCCQRKHLYLRGYLPHLGALCGCLIGFSLKIPLFYASICIIYQQTGDPLMLTNLLVAVVFICAWVITWFGFTLKQNWRFHLPNGSKVISDISSMTIANSMSAMTRLKRNSRDLVNPDSSIPIYTCCHSSNPRFIIGGNGLQNEDIYSEENVLTNNPTTNNYVYLQSAMNPAINHLLKNKISQSQSCGSPHQMLFNDNIDSRNAILDSESSCDSSSNIRNQMLLSLDPHIGCLQGNNSRPTGGSLKCSENIPESCEYIQLKSDDPHNSNSKIDDCSSIGIKTLLAVDSDINLKSLLECQQKFNQSVSLNRHNSNKKRIHGQRVTFKDEHLANIAYCSPNNSEQSSNNTSCSDSGIDNNSKQPREILQMNLLDINNTNLTKRSGISNYELTSKFIPSSSHPGISLSSTYFDYCNIMEPVDVSTTMLKSLSQNIIVPNELISTSVERSTLSYLPESDKDQLCSQV